MEESCITPNLLNSRSYSSSGGLKSPGFPPSIVLPSIWESMGFREIFPQQWKSENKEDSKVETEVKMFLIFDWVAVGT